MKKESLPETSFLNSSFKTIDVLTRSHKVRQTPAENNLRAEFDAIDWIVEANEPQTLDDVAIPLSELELL